MLEELYFAHSTQKFALHNATKESQERELIMKNFLTQSEDTLLSIRKLKLFDSYLSKQNNQEILEDIFLAYAKSQPTFMQVRFIDRAGVERIRIDRKNEESVPYIVPHTKQQNKASRYYFADSKSKPLEKVWFSALDLNMEQGKVQIPFTPTFRSILPLKHNGEFGGILIINYFMQNFLQKFSNTPLYDMIIYNDQGYTLSHYDANKSWGAFREEKITIAKLFPNEYQTIRSSQLLQSDSFISRKLHLPIYNGINLILQLKSSYIQEQKSLSQKQYFLISSIIFGFSLLLTLIIIKLFSRTLLNLNKVTQLNESLHNKTDELESILEIALEGVAVLDLETNYLYCNKRYEEITGYTENELRTKCCYDLTAENFTEQSKKIYAKILEDGSYENFERTCFTKSGQAKIFKSSIALMPDKKRYLVTTTDITQLKEQAQEIDEYLKIIDQNIIISRTDIQGNIIYVSEQFAKSTGYSKEEILGKNHRIFRHPDMDKSIYNDLWSHISRDIPWKGVLKNRRKDKATYWTKLFITPQYNLYNEKIGYLAVRNDITEQKEIEEIAIIDALTNIYNRRYYEEITPKFLNEVKKENNYFGLAILDVDNFKLYNDTYGHLDGDNVLRMIGKLLKSSHDCCFRVGGEEFVLFYNISKQEECINAIETIRKSIQALNIEHKKNGSYNCITISIGLVCEKISIVKDLDTIYKEADRRLYKAKNNGRNKVVSS